MLRFGSVRLALPAVSFDDVSVGTVRFGATHHSHLPTSHPTSHLPPGGRWEVGGGSGGVRRRGLGVRREGFGSVWCGLKFFGSVRYGSGRFDAILGESIVETAMIIGSMANNMVTARTPQIQILSAPIPCINQALGVGFSLS